MGALKHCRECNMEKIAQGRSRETNIARGKAECYIIRRPRAIFSILHLRSVL